MSYSPAKIEPEKDASSETENSASNQKPAPSWFVDRPGRDLADAYRSQREAREKMEPVQDYAPAEFHDRRIEERFENARRMFDRPERELRHAQQPQPRVRRPVLTPIVVPSSEAQAKAKTPASRPPRWGRFAGMSAMALVIGGGIGFGFAKRDMITEFARGKVQEASVSLPNFKAWSEAPATTISKKEVSMASLDVNDARGTLNSMIPLMLHAAAGDAANPIDIKISGLPPSAYLSAGKRSGVSDWTVATNEIDGLKLVVPSADQSKLDLEVAALDQKSGALAAPVKSLSIALDVSPKAVAPADTQLQATLPGDVQIQPVSAPPDTSGNNFNKTTVDGLDYLSKGDALMKTGDIASARQFYLKANDLGNPNGAFGVARTYDPKVFAELNVQGMDPDPALAAQWYQKAAAAGVTKTP
jgi:hypothetical protein